MISIWNIKIDVKHDNIPILDDKKVNSLFNESKFVKFVFIFILYSLLFSFRLPYLSCLLWFTCAICPFLSPSRNNKFGIAKRLCRVTAYRKIFCRAKNRVTSSPWKLRSTRKLRISWISVEFSDVDVWWLKPREVHGDATRSCQHFFTPVRQTRLRFKLFIDRKRKLDFLR